MFNNIKKSLFPLLILLSALAISTSAATISGNNALSTLNSLNPITYNWTSQYQNASPKATSATQSGFLANEFATVFADAVTTSPTDLIQQEDGNYRVGLDIEEGETKIIENLKGIDAIVVIPYLVAAIKELQARIEVLEGE